MTLDPNLTLVLLALVGVIVPLSTLLIKFVQDSRIAQEEAQRSIAAAFEVRRVADKVEKAREQQAVQATAAAVEVQLVAAALDVDRKAWGQNQDRTDEKLDSIHTLVNSRLTQALDTIEELKMMLKNLAPDDERVKKLVSSSQS
jgi:hypothetical protein